MTGWFTRKKRVQIKGKWTWVKPAYAKVHYHNVPDDDQPRKTRRIWVKAGTQIIDRVWGELRKHLGTRKPVNTKMLTNKIRSFQWLHWHRGEDLWLATGEMLEEAFLREHGE